MSLRNESGEHYQQALKLGRKLQRQRVSQGLYPYLQILDEILPGYTTAGQEELGTIEIPVEKIVGTKTRGRSDAFAANFMPLIPMDSEFGLKWRNLCEFHLGESGIRDPVSCYEFLGRFYVQEGNKRVSVLKYFGAATIMGNVIRILPGESSQPEVIAYKAFLGYYPKRDCMRCLSLSLTVFRNCRQLWGMSWIISGRKKNAATSVPVSTISTALSKSSMMIR